jgi:dipeptidyl aminopeptidase/acylaminoacyl peptidase
MRHLSTLMSVLVMLYSLFALPQSHAISTESNKEQLAPFFKSAKYKHFSISPSGNRVAYIAPKANTYDLIIYEVATGKTNEPITFTRRQTDVGTQNGITSWEVHFNRIYDLLWLSDDFISLQQHSNGRFHRYVLVELGPTGSDGSLPYRLSYVSQHGYWADTLPHDRNHAVFAKYEQHDDYVFYTDLFKIDLREKVKDSTFRKKYRLNKSGPKLHDWIFDNNGWRVAGTRTVDRSTELYARTGSSPRKYRYKSVWTGDRDDSVKVVGFDAASNALLVLTNHKSDKVNLRRFDIESQRFTDTVFEHPSYDLRSAIYEPETKNIIGVSFLEKGITKQHYFSEDYSRFVERLSAQTGTNGINAIAMDANSRNILFFADDSANPGEVFIYHRERDAFNSITSLYPWLADKGLRKTQTISVSLDSGQTLEAFLTLPDVKNPPLVVIPHGGPIGISDSRHYSSNIQVLVNAGFATLQVNYRGSQGYGKAFMRQGMQQWGRLIEDDIEAALQHTVKNFSVDQDNVCIIGGSYGGYSALYSIIRSPELYNCAASFAGVTDLALQFQRSDVKDDATMTLLTEIIGDPVSQQALLFEYSPLYQHEQITKPVFLAHGTDDVIVDIEHAYRLHFALQSKGIEHEWKVMDNVGHGFDYTSDAADYYFDLIQFLNKHLRNDATSTIEPSKTAE